MKGPVVLVGADPLQVERLLAAGAWPVLVMEADLARRAAIPPRPGVTVVATPAATWEVVSGWRGDLSTTRLLVTTEVQARAPALVASVQRAVVDGLRDAGMRQRTQSERYPAMVRSSLANLPHLAEVAPADAGRPWAGRTVFLLAAGPSLDRALPHLRAVAEQGVLVVVNTAARAACTTGARLDVLVALEALSDARELEGVAARFGELVLDVTAGGGLFGTGRPTSVFRQEGWMDELLADVPVLTAGTSVAGAAASLAVARGAARIVLLGQDLSYPEGRMYAAASGRGDWRAIPEGDALLLGYPDTLLARFEAGGVTRPARRVQRVVLPAWGGKGTVDSTPDLAGVARWFERFAETAREQGTPVELLNATGGGAHLAGWRDVALEDVLAAGADARAEHFAESIALSAARFGASRRRAVRDEVVARLDRLDAAMDACLAGAASFEAVRSALRALPSVNLLEGAAILTATKVPGEAQLPAVIEVIRRGAGAVRGALEA